MKKILIAAPLEYELAPIRRALADNKDPFRCSFLALGVGPKHSVTTLEKFLGSDPEWDLVLVVGLAGSLTDELKTGDIVTPSLIVDGNSASNPPLKVRGEGGIMFHNPSSSPYLKGRGEVRAIPFLTVNRILKPAEKQSACAAHPEVQAVDMESYGLTELLSKRGIFFNIFRSILDEKDYIFPDFRWVFSQQKRRDVLPFLFYACRHPYQAARVLELKDRMKRSLKRLSDFTALYLEKMLESETAH